MPLLDQRRAFLDEVLAHPDDDVPRLIFADYLQELGDPRGEFIRLQCELAQLDELDPRYLDISHRCDALLSLHGEQWAGELKQDVRKTEFSRGFIDKITVRARALVQQADDLFQSTPVHWLRFNYLKGAGEKLACTEALSRIRCLDLSGLVIPETDLIALLRSPHLNHLRALNLTSDDTTFSESVGASVGQMDSASSLEHLELPWGREFLEAIARSGGFAQLKHLSVGQHYFDPELSGLAGINVPKLESLQVRGTMKMPDCETIARLPVAQLRKLNLRSTRIPGRGLKMLAERGALDQIVELNLSGTGLRPRTLNTLFQGERLRSCELLDLSRNREIRDQGLSRLLAERLSAHNVMTSLRRLHLCGLDTSDLRLIAEAEQFHRLNFLELDSTRLGLDDVQALAASPLGSSLRHLRLIGCTLAPAAIRRLWRGDVFPNLLRVDLGSTWGELSGWRESELIRLLTSQAFSHVQAIGLHYLLLSSKTLKAIAERGAFPELREISFCHNHASKRSVDAVLNSPRLPKLRKIVLTGTGGLNRQKLLAEHGPRVAF